jgi:hypothetical protein
MPKMKVPLRMAFASHASQHHYQRLLLMIIEATTRT